MAAVDAGGVTPCRWVGGEGGWRNAVSPTPGAWSDSEATRLPSRSVGASMPPRECGLQPPSASHHHAGLSPLRAPATAQCSLACPRPAQTSANGGLADPAIAAPDLPPPSPEASPPSRRRLNVSLRARRAPPEEGPPPS